MKRASVRAIGGVAGSLALLACTADPAVESEERVGAAEQSVINGAPDAGHPMVVAYLHDGGLCSATIIATSGSTGYALTAGHCIGASAGEIVVGSSISNPVKKYPVVDRVQFPGYPAVMLYDIAMLKFSGADASTPVMPVLTPALDDLKAGKTVDIVGFGKTQDNGGTIGEKQHKFMPIQYVTDLRLIYDQKSGGLCSGDSGGPSTYYPALEYVAGVHSYVSSNNGTCLQEGTDIRVSAFVEPFILPYIEGKPFGKLTCGQCSEAQTFQGQCTNAVIACYKSPQCQGYQSCINICETNACVANCKNKYASGYTLYQDILSCVCDTGCATECAEADFCNPPKCGVTAAKPACQSCLETSCCAEAEACSSSATCLDCVGALVPGAECKTDATTVAYNECLAANCSEACSIPSGTTSSASSGAGGDASGGAGGAGGTGGDASAGVSTNGAGGASPKPFVVESSSCSIGRSEREGSNATSWLIALAGAAVLVRRQRART